MKPLTRLLATCLSLIAACAGVGIVSTKDPLAKLNDAAILFREKNRPVPAEGLIDQAIAIYQREDDAHGLGNGYREYGDLLSSSAVVRWEPQYRRNGFFDRSITFDNRLAKAKEFYRKALVNYDRAARQHKEAGQYDALTNVYFGMAWSHAALDEIDQACEDYDRTLGAYTENMRRNPSAKPVFPPRFSNLPEAITYAKQRAGCRSR